MAYQLDILTDEADFWALSPEWNDLLVHSSANNIFLTWEWVSTWWRCFGADYQLWLVTVRENGRLQAIAPLVLRQQVRSNKIKYRELIFLGSNEAAPDHLDFIVRQDADVQVWEALTKHIWANRGHWDIIFLESAIATSTAVKLLQGYTVKRWQQESVLICPAVPLPESWEKYMQQVGGRMRRKLKRHERQLAGAGDVKFTRVIDATELPAVLSELRQMHQALPNGGAFQNMQMESFQREAATAFLQQRWLRCFRLQVDGVDIGFAYGFAYANKLYYYMTGYDPKWSHYGPGWQITAHAIRCCIEEGMQEVDILRGDEPYKYKWLAEAKKTLCLKIAGSSRGKLLMEAKAFKSALRD
jgi:CelD/BcsL family acetyltransferase involved in cellulose biosynthesis